MLCSRLCRFAAVNRPAPPRVNFNASKFTANHPIENMVENSAALVSDGRQLTINDLDPAAIDTNPKAMNKMWSKTLLSQYCKAHGLAYSGRKLDLIGRIRGFWGITNDGNYGLTEVKLRPSEYFLVKGINSQNIDRISKIANVRITADDTSNALVIKGEVQGVLKTRQLIRDYIKDIATESIKLPKSFSEHDQTEVVDVIRKFSGAFAIKDAESDELLVAAPMKANIQLAKQIIDGIKQTSRKRFSDIRMDLPDSDIGPSLAFYPSSDISWDPYHRRLLACRLRKLSSSLSDDRKECFFSLTRTDDHESDESSDYVDLDNVKRRLNHLLKDDNVSVEVGVGHALFSDKLSSDSNPFLSVLSLMGNNIKVGEFKKWFAGIRPYISFLPATVSEQRLAKYFEPSSLIEPYSATRHLYLNEDSRKHILVTERDKTVRAILCPHEPGQTLILNVNRPLDYYLSISRTFDINVDVDFIVNQAPKTLEYDGQKFILENSAREKVVESDDGIEIAHVTSPQAGAKTFIRTSATATKSSSINIDKLLELVRKLT